MVFMAIMASSPAADWNLDGDCIVNAADFAIFAAGWQTVYDVNDLAGFAEAWLTYDGQSPPEARPIAGYCLRGTAIDIDLTAADEGLPDPPATVTYTLYSLPARGTLRDGADPNTPIAGVPHTLTGAAVRFVSDPDYGGDVAFIYGADDGGTMPCGGEKRATVTIECNGPPTAFDAAVDAVAFEPRLINLPAEDNGLPSPPAKLKYTITSLPQAGTLQDPAAGAGILIERRLPTRLSSWGGDVLFWTQQAGVETFTFTADDGGAYPSGGPSAEATVTLTVADHPRDRLAFSGGAAATAAANAIFDIRPGFAVHVYARTTRGTTGTIARKRDPGGAGWQLDLAIGRPRLRVWDAGGALAAEAVGPWRIDDGAWHAVTAGMWTQAGAEYISVHYEDGLQSPVPIAAGDYASTAGLVVGDGYRGELDKLRFFAAWDPTEMLTGGIIEIGDEPRLTTEEIVLGIGVASAVRWMCDEGAGQTATDDKLGLTLSLGDPNAVRWHPWIDPRLDVSPLTGRSR